MRKKLVKQWAIWNVTLGKYYKTWKFEKDKFGDDITVLYWTDKPELQFDEEYEALFAINDIINNFELGHEINIVSWYVVEEND